MLTIIWIIQIICALLLTILVLLHSPKGDGIGAMGGMSNLFSSQKSAESGLNKLTAIIAFIFIVASLITGFHTVSLITFCIIALMVIVTFVFLLLSKK